MLVNANVSSPLEKIIFQMNSLQERVASVKCSFISEFIEQEKKFVIPRIEFKDKNTKDRIRIGIFGSIHGDEPVGAYALLEFFSELIQNDQDASGYEIIAYPVCNPFGFEMGTRLNGREKDLNREFWKGSDLPEVKALEREILSNRFHGIISLHSDDTSTGIYGFVQGAALYYDLLRPSLKAASQVLPINGAAEIDGFTAFNGLIKECYPGVLSMHPSIKVKPFELIFETPSDALLHHQIQATKIFLYSVLRNYRSFISYAQNI